MKINFSKIPKYYIIGANLKSPRDITEFFARKNIKYYCYDIQVVDSHTGQKNCSKIGMSANIKSDPGDRAYRQLGHLPSWGDNLRLFGPNGSDFVIVAELFKKKYNYDIDHRYCFVTIYDMTNYPFISMNPRTEILAAEELLIMEHKKQFGEIPVGNLIESYSNADKAVVETLHFNGLFRVEE